MKKLFIQKFKEIIREQIAEGNQVNIEGLGKFEKVHEKQEQKKYENGRVVMLPPRDKVEFQSEIKQQNDN